MYVSWVRGEQGRNSKTSNRYPFWIKKSIFANWLYHPGWMDICMYPRSPFSSTTPQNEKNKATKKYSMYINEYIKTERRKIMIMTKAKAKVWWIGSIHKNESSIFCHYYQCHAILMIMEKNIHCTLWTMLVGVEWGTEKMWPYHQLVQMTYLDGGTLGKVSSALRGTQIYEWRFMVKHITVTFSIL